MIIFRWSYHFWAFYYKDILTPTHTICQKDQKIEKLALRVWVFLIKLVIFLTGKTTKTTLFNGEI